MKRRYWGRWLFWLNFNGGIGEVDIMVHEGAILEEGLVKGRYYHLGTVPVVFQVLLVCSQ